MNPGVSKLLELGFQLLSLKVEHDAIVGRVREMEAAGASQDEISAALEQMRDQALAAAQRAIDEAP